MKFPLLIPYCPPYRPIWQVEDSVGIYATGPHEWLRIWGCRFKDDPDGNSGFWVMTAQNQPVNLEVLPTFDFAHQLIRAYLDRHHRKAGTWKIA